MALNSFTLILLFLILCIVLGALQFLNGHLRKPIVQNTQLTILLLFSYFFVCKLDLKFGACLLLVTLVSYFGAYKLSSIENLVHRRNCLGILVGFLILVLAYFKYTNFFLEGITSALGMDSITLNIILPLGISFYIFTAIGYLVDIYRKDYSAERNILNFALFIALFTKLTAGPIIRSKELLPQLREYKGLTWDRFAIGIQIFLIGLFKKIVIADHLGVFVNDVYKAPEAFTTGTVALAVISYALQIYFDFAGYSDMAIGMSKVLGFDLSQNFNFPYLAKNPSDFWARWHISLSSWLRDYLYIPLGGSRKGIARTYINLMVVMLLSGLWHGAGLTFILWGGLHGTLCCIHKVLNNMFKDSATKENHNCFVAMLTSGLKMLMMFIVATLLWVPFRAESFEKTERIFNALFTVHTGMYQPYMWSFVAIILLAIASAIALYNSNKMGLKKVESMYPIMDLTKVSGLTAFFVFAGLTIILGYFGNTAFIYGNF